MRFLAGGSGFTRWFFCLSPFHLIHTEIDSGRISHVRGDVAGHNNINDYRCGGRGGGGGKSICSDSPTVRAMRFHQYASDSTSGLEECRKTTLATLSLRTPVRFTVIRNPIVFGRSAHDRPWYLIATVQL